MASFIERKQIIIAGLLYKLMETVQLDPKTCNYGFEIKESEKGAWKISIPTSINPNQNTPEWKLEKALDTESAHMFGIVFKQDSFEKMREFLGETILKAEKINANPISYAEREDKKKNIALAPSGTAGLGILPYTGFIK